MYRILAPLFEKRNRGSCCGSFGRSDNGPMENPKSAKITQVHKDEATRLLKLFKERVTVSQAQFAHDHGLGSQGNLSHYLGARSPLNLVAALKFAVGLQCHLSAFSERLDKELSDLLGLVSALPKPADEKVVRLPWPEDSVFTKAVKILQGESEEGRKLALAGMMVALQVNAPAEKKEIESPKANAG